MARRAKKVNLWQQLKEINEKFRGDDVILGKEMLGFPRKTDAARETMYINHLDQRLNLGGGGKVEKPRIFGNYEDVVGDMSSYIHKTKGRCVVDKIIEKFPSSDEVLRAPFLVFVHYTDTDLYDVIEIHDVENMVEKYGFEYDNTKAMNLKEGQELDADDMINSPNCYDVYGNYGFGKNYTFMYQISDTIIEDGIEISDEVALDIESDKYFGSVEVYSVRQTVNDNNILINTYGDANQWKSFPDIGEQIIGDQVCTCRVVNTAQILYDLKSSNTRRRLSSDAPAFVSGTVVDIDIFCNKRRDELPDTVFDQQILRYYDTLLIYNEKIAKYTQELIDNGCNITDKIRVMNKDSSDYIDEDVKYKDENDRIFSKMVIYFTIKKNVGVLKGQKITGRHGNKGVVSKITPKELMPHLETGKSVDIILETLGPVNRLNIFQLYEQSITFICNRNVEYMRTVDIPEKERILFRTLEIFNQSQRDAIYDNYKKTCKTKKDKEEYFRIVDKYGIYINVPPYWDTVNLYDAVGQCYEEFAWIKPYKVYFYEETSKRWVKMMNDQIIGEMYFIKLKQSSKKGLSARSTGPVNRKGVPDKTDSAKKFQVPYSNIAVRRGKQEAANDLMSIDPEKTALEQLAFRSSPIARKWLATQLMENYVGIDKFEPTEEMTNINVQIFSSYLLMMGLEMIFEHDELDLTDTPGIKNHIYNNRRYYCSTDDMKSIIAKDIANARFVDKAPGALYFGPETTTDDFLDQLANQIKDDLFEYL